MLKKLLLVLAVISLASCHGKAKKSDLAQDNFQVEDQTNKPVAPYQTLESEQQAMEMNQQEQAQEKEVEVQDRVFFAYDSAAVSEDAKKILDTQIAWLKSDGGIGITIEGHCDERGTREYNIALGDRRATAVKAYLIKNGVEASRIKTISYGKERPAYFGTSEEIMSKNRRAVTVAR